LSTELPPLVELRKPGRPFAPFMIVEIRMATPLGDVAGNQIVRDWGHEPATELDIRIAVDRLIRTMRRFVWKQGLQYVI
jgi:hypothetical protein